jgi:parallel beta-helix repeat protein
MFLKVFPDIKLERGKAVKRKWLAIGIIFLSVGVTIASAIAQDTQKCQSISRGKWLYVGGSGPGNFTTIQSAIYYASDGDTVYVYNDSSPYHEWVFIMKSISLIGEDKNTTIIEGIDDGMGGVIQIGPTDSVLIKSFTINNTLPNDSGIDSHQNFNITITDMNIISRGIAIETDECNNSSFSSCMLTSIDEIGFGLYFSSYDVITDCNLINNGLYGIYIQHSSNNTIYHNNFLNNSYNAMIFDECDNIWDNEHPSGGNYWDDYAGSDNNGDGIGDTPYNISGGIDQDYYPFMKPNGWMSEPFTSIFVGLITDLNDTGGDIISFKAKFVFYTKLDPLEIGRVIPDEEIWVSREHQGYLGPRFILGIFNVIKTEFP